MDKLEELEKLVEHAVVEGDWECPEGCFSPQPDPDNGALCEECCENEKESKRIPTGYGMPELHAYLEKNVRGWK